RSMVTGPAWVPSCSCSTSPGTAPAMARARLSPPGMTTCSAASAGQASSRARIGVSQRIGSARLRLDHHAPAHLHMQRVAEPLAVIPVDARIGGHEGHRRSLLGRDLHRNAMVAHGKAVGQVVDLIKVGDDDRDLVAFIYRKAL